MFAKPISIAVLSLCAASLAAADEHRVRFPADYATQFSNYLSLDRIQNPDQTIRLFANDTAMGGAGEDGSLPNGSVLVAEIYSAVKDADGNVVTSELGRRIRGGMAAIAVMEKQEGWGEAYPEPLRNGDWDFAVFSPEGERLDKDLNACRSCHAPLKDRDHVFSHKHIVRQGNPG